VEAGQCTVTEVEVSCPQVGDFLDTGAGVVEEQQQRPIS
jgi:hypothetical protein